MNRFIGLLDSVKGTPLERRPLNMNNYPERLYLVRDNPDLFRSSGERYLDRKIHQVRLVDIADLERKV